MVRALTRDQLANEAGVDISRIERLTEIGVVTPDRNGMYSAGDVIRVESVQPFIDAGMSLETLEQGISQGLYTFEYLDRFYPEPTPLSDYRVAELARALSIPDELLRSVYLAMGLPMPDPHRRVPTDEVEIVRSFLETWAIADRDAVLRAARLIGESARLVSEGWTRLYVEKISEPMAAQDVPMDQRIPIIVETTERATRLVPKMLVWLLYRHVRQSVDRANLEGLEESMARQGYVLPGPPRIPAIAFVDVSGYTTMTEKYGDEVALRTSEIVRDQGQAVARQYGGSVVKILGDGVMLHFERVRQAVPAVLELVKRLQSEGLPAHAGVHAGALIHHDGDYYGRTVNLASRVASAAGPGEVVVTHDVVETGDWEDLAFEPLSPVDLKGVDRPPALYRTRFVDASKD